MTAGELAGAYAARLAARRPEDLARHERALLEAVRAADAAYPDGPAVARILRRGVRAWAAGVRPGDAWSLPREARRLLDAHDQARGSRKVRGPLFDPPAPAPDATPGFQAELFEE